MQDQTGAGCCDRRDALEKVLWEAGLPAGCHRRVRQLQEVLRAGARLGPGADQAVHQAGRGIGAPQRLRLQVPADQVFSGTEHGADQAHL